MSARRISSISFSRNRFAPICRRRTVTADIRARLADIYSAANLDIGLPFDEHGRLKPIRQAPIEVRRARLMPSVPREHGQRYFSLVG
jgi:hypothetical protein